MVDETYLVTYRLMVQDSSRGTRKPVPTAPIYGRAAAEQILARILLANNDTRLQYDIEEIPAPMHIQPNTGRAAQAGRL